MFSKGIWRPGLALSSFSALFLAPLRCLGALAGGFGLSERKMSRDSRAIRVLLQEAPAGADLAGTAVEAA